MRHGEASAGNELETVDEGIAVKGLVGESAHDEHVERALEEIGSGLGHIKTFYMCICRMSRYAEMASRTRIRVSRDRSSIPRGFGLRVVGFAGLGWAVWGQEFGVAVALHLCAPKQHRTPNPEP
jgi:hypothetical protein